MKHTPKWDDFEDIDDTDGFIFPEDIATEEKMGAGEAALLGASDILPGVGALTAGAGAKLGELWAKYVEGAPVDEAQEKLKELGITDPTDTGLGTFTEAKRAQVKKEEKAFEDQPAAFLGGSMLGPAGSLGTIIKGAKAISKAGKAGKLISKVLPSLKGAKKATMASNMAKKARLAGNFDEYVRLKKIAGSTRMNVALREGLKAGGMAGLVKGEGTSAKDIATETAAMAAFGGGLGYGMSGLGRFVESTFSDTKIGRGIVNRVIAGFKGKDVYLESFEKYLRDLGRTFGNDLLEEVGKSGANIKQIKSILEKSGVKINSMDDLVKLKNTLENSGDKKALSGLIDVVDNYLAGGKAYKKGQEKLFQKSVKKAVEDVSKGEQQSSKQITNIAKKQALTGKVPEDISDELIDAQGKKILKTTAKYRPEVALDEKGKMILGNNGAPKFNKPKTMTQVDDVTPYNPSPVQEIDIQGQKFGTILDETSQKPLIESLGPSTPLKDPSNLDVSEATDLKALMNKYSSISGEAALVGDSKYAAQQVSKNIQEKLNTEALQEGLDLGAANEKYSNFMDMFKNMGMDSDGNYKSKFGKDKNLADKMEEFIRGKFATEDFVSPKEIDWVWDTLKNKSPKLYDKYRIPIENARENFRILKLAESGPIHSFKAEGVLGSIESVIYKGSQIAGQTAAIPKNITAAASNFITTMAPDAVRDLAKKLATKGTASGKKFVKPLLNAANGSERSRQAVLWGLYQNPSFREAVFGKLKKDNNE